MLKKKCIETVTEHGEELYRYVEMSPCEAAQHIKTMAFVGLHEMLKFHKQQQIGNALVAAEHALRSIVDDAAALAKELTVKDETEAEAAEANQVSVELLRAGVVNG